KRRLHYRIPTRKLVRPGRARDAADKQPVVSGGPLAEFAMKRPRLRVRLEKPGLELGYLNDHIKYALHRGRAPHADMLSRFAVMLDLEGRDSESIAHQEYWVLLYQAEGKLNDIIVHRKRHIRQVERLF